MPIDKAITVGEQQLAQFHKAVQAVPNLAEGSAVVIVASWASLAAAQAGQGAVWQQQFELNMADLADVDAALLQQAPFVDGLLVGDVPAGLEAAKARKWAQIKASRAAAEFGTVGWGGSIFDADAPSQARIQGAVILAMQALAAAQAFELAWTLADNSTRQLSAADAIALGQALALHVQAQHGTARQLRQQIEAAETLEALAAIHWPA